MIDESLSAKSEITLTKENPTKISSSNSTTDIEKPSSSISSQLSQFPPSLNSLYLPFTQLFSKNTITVDMFCKAYYQPDDYYAVSHGRVNILKPKFKMNKQSICFAKPNPP